MDTTRVSYNTMTLSTRQNDAMNRKQEQPETFNTISDYLQLIRSGGGQQLNRKPLFGLTSAFRQHEDKDASRLPNVQAPRENRSLEAILSKFSSSQTPSVYPPRNPCHDVTIRTYSTENVGNSTVITHKDETLQLGASRAAAANNSWLHRTDPENSDERKRTASQGLGEKRSARITLAMRPIDGKINTNKTVLTGSTKRAPYRALIGCEEMMTHRRDVISRTHAARFKPTNSPTCRNNSSVSQDRTSANEWRHTENGNVVRKTRNRVPVWEVDYTGTAREADAQNHRSSREERPSSWMTSAEMKVSSSNNTSSARDKDKLLFSWDSIFSKPRLDSLLNTQTDVQRFRRLLRESTDEEATDSRVNHCDAPTTDRIETWLREVRRVRDTEGLCSNTFDESLESEQHLLMTSSSLECLSDAVQ